MTGTIYGIALILIGLIYLWKPTMFRRGLWMKTSIAIRMFSEENYTRYMRVLGLIFIAAGIGLVIYGAIDHGVLAAQGGTGGVRRSSPSPRLRGEGWGEGDSPRVRIRRESPSPEAFGHSRGFASASSRTAAEGGLCSPRKRGEVRD